jgi:hypothetical protein
MRLLIEAVLIGAAFVLGTARGKRIEADAIAAGLRLKSYAQTETGRVYSRVILDIQRYESSLLGRLKAKL